MNEKEFINEMAEHIIRDESSLFLGAGSSCSVGFPSWGKLLEECAHKLNIKSQRYGFVFDSTILFK